MSFFLPSLEEILGPVSRRDAEDMLFLGVVGSLTRDGVVHSYRVAHVVEEGALSKCMLVFV